MIGKTGSRLGLGAAAAVAALGLASMALAQAGSPAGTDPRLEGVWVVKSAERSLFPFNDVIGATVTFKGGTYSIERTDGRSKWFGKLAADAKSGKIDMLNEADTAVFPLKGEKWEGIYRFNGPTLEIITSQAHDARPTEFTIGYELADLKLEKR